MNDIETKNDLKYLRAKDAIKRIRGFYGHLFVFLMVILAVAILPIFDVSFCFMCFSDNHWMNMLGLIPWGIGLLIHGLVTFRVFAPLHKWEERKIKEFMELDEE
ncbi:2TM domain-containing protein [Dokdonia sp.]|uniref:2TM domain-containing protein n=1 Tax=Dokdonia sp. TaxID=2024995 RepID=UPI003266BE69